MRVLSGAEAEEAMRYILIAAEIAKEATCKLSKCGSVVVKEGSILGEGFNSLPQGEELVSCLKNSRPDDFTSDPTCCMHAEQRAIMQALETKADRGFKDLAGSRIYFIRLDEQDEIKYATRIKCTICSKMALDTGIEEFVLFRAEGITVYNTKEYNELSFGYGK